MTIKQWLCALRGHTYTIRFEDQSMHLVCDSCGRMSDGYWIPDRIYRRSVSAQQERFQRRIAESRQVH